MGVQTSEVGYTSVTTRRESTKSMTACGGIGFKKKPSEHGEHMSNFLSESNIMVYANVGSPF
jgi:hypothetical protein